MQIVASALSADFARLGEDCRDPESAGADRIRWDVMDGRFVPNLIFGPDVVAAVRPQTALPFEAHLMVRDPDAWPARLVQAGRELIIVHVEAATHLHRTLAPESVAAGQNALAHRVRCNPAALTGEYVPAMEQAVPVVAGSTRSSRAPGAHKRFLG